MRDQQHKPDALYHLESDPGETRNLSEQEPRKKEELLAVGRAFLEKCPPSSGPLAQQDTRVKGGRESDKEMLEHCKDLLMKAR